MFPMDTNLQPSPIEQAAKLAGGVSSLAGIIGVSPQAVYKWIWAGRAPVDRCIEIETAVKGKVTRRQLCPEMFAAKGK